MGPNLEPKWYGKLRRSRFGLTFGAFAGLLVGAAATTEAVDKLAISIGLKKNALDLAQDSEKAKFSRDLAKAAWHRLFVMRRVVLSIKDNFPQSDRESEWKSYSVILDEWNRDLMVNILLLEQYYGNDKRNEFEASIQPQFGRLHYCLEALRRSSRSIECKISETRDIGAIEKALDRLNGQLYCFVSGLPEKDIRCR